MSNILLVDDDPGFSNMLAGYLSRNEFNVTEVLSSGKALQQLKENTFTLVLADFNLPDMNGIELIKKIKIFDPNLPVILITSYTDLRVAVNSIKLGAYEFINKPVIPDELLAIIRNALSSKKDESEQRTTKPQNEKVVKGTGKMSVSFWEHLALVAPTNMTVMIFGESGTGKEYAARMIHENSRRKGKPFIALDCGVLSGQLAVSELFGHVKGAYTGAISDKTGAFEQAAGGTLFLDEIGNLPYDVQVQLLRAIQERTIKKLGSGNLTSVDVRIIAATNEDLKDKSNSKEFRDDLFHRLNEFELSVPPLRDRLDDLQDFVDFFIQEAVLELDKEIDGVAPDTMKLLMQYHWPGNLRELRNVIKRAVLLSQNGIINREEIPINIQMAEKWNEPTILQETTDLKARKEIHEKELIIKLLKKNKYNKSKTARDLNIDRTTLYYKIHHYEIDL